MKEFVTETDSKYARIKYSLITIGIYLIFATLGTLLLLVKLSTFIFFEGIAFAFLILAIFMVIRNNSHFILYISKDLFRIVGNGPNQIWEMEDISLSDFILTQSEDEKKFNRCTLVISNTKYKFYGVENYSDFKEFLEKNVKIYSDEQ
ncbi:MAG: hypothetical protein IJW54_00530 [Clostridia bacterium]|nr:hypothetical protein [Clostridia bacterium]